MRFFPHCFFPEYVQHLLKLVAPNLSVFTFICLEEDNGDVSFVEIIVVV
jgi:hypothetical protein